MSQIDYVLGDTLPEPGTTIELAPGVHWLRMPLPFQLNHINLWLLEDGAGWTIVDTGLATRTILGLWEQLFAERLGTRPVTRVLVTHFHPDHMGCAGWLTERWGVPMWTSQTEWLYARALMHDNSSQALDNVVEFYRKVGLSVGALDLIRQRGNPYPARVSPVPSAFRRVRAGETIAIGARQWRVIIGTGHAPEHICLASESDRILISGDQVLPRITPNVSVWPDQPEGDPLADFLGSLAAFEPLDPNTLVLPSHDRPFRGLHTRIAGLARHHAERLDAFEALCDGAATVAEIMARSFKRELDAHQVIFACGETLAHLHRLVHLGRVDRTSDAAGVWRYARA